MNEQWTDSDKAALRVIWRDGTVLNDDLPLHFGRTLDAIRYKAWSMRLGPRPAGCDGRRLAAEQRRLEVGEKERGRPGAHWTDAQVAVLTEFWPDIEAISRATGRSESGVEKKARTMRLPPRNGHRLPDLEALRSYKELQRLKVRPVEPRVDRNCLCCTRPFSAPTRFIRLCDRCRGQSEGLV